MPRLRTHPGEVLKEEFLDPLGMSANGLASLIGVPSNRLTEIIRGRRGMSADTAHRLARFFDTTPGFWMNLQTNYDLSEAESTHDYSTLLRGKVAGQKAGR